MIVVGASCKLLWRGDYDGVWFVCVRRLNQYHDWKLEEKSKVDSRNNGWEWIWGTMMRLRSGSVQLIPMENLKKKKRRGRAPRYTIKDKDFWVTESSCVTNRETDRNQWKGRLWKWNLCFISSEIKSQTVKEKEKLINK